MEDMASNIMDEGKKKLFGDGSKRKRAKKLKEELEKELKSIFCVKKATGMHAKRQVTFSQIFSLLMLFLLGSMAGSMVLL